MEVTEWKNGPHLLKFEPPDIYHCYVNAPVHYDEVQETLRVMEAEVYPKVGLVFFLLHMTPGIGGLSSEARKAMAGHTPRWKCAIIIGGSPIMRIATDVVMRAMYLLSGQKAPTRMVKDEAEARALMDEMRASQKARLAAS